MTLSRRTPYAIAAVAIIAVGLLTRLPLLELPRDVARPLGSVLWGAMVYCIVRFGLLRLRRSASTGIATFVAAAVEFSQLWHTAWLDAFRRTTIGVLLIGRYFAWQDIALYAGGIFAACLVEVAVGIFPGKARGRAASVSKLESL